MKFIAPCMEFIFLCLIHKLLMFFDHMDYLDFFRLRLQAINAEAFGSLDADLPFEFTTCV